MPAVRLTRYECERDLLPRVCAQCGVPAEDGVRFALLGPILNTAFGTLMVFCPPLFLILVHLLSRRRRFLVPMCDPDRAEWRRRDRFITRTYVVLVAGSYCVAIALLALASAERAADWDRARFLDAVKLFAIAGYFVFLYAWFNIAVVQFVRTVRTSKVMKRGIRLSGVHAEFVRALMTDRVRTRDSDPARVAWYGDARDDFEEDWNEDGVFRPEAQTGPVSASVTDSLPTLFRRGGPEEEVIGNVAKTPPPNPLPETGRGNQT